MGGSGNQQQTLRTQQNLSPWALPQAQSTIAAYKNYIQPTAAQLQQQQAGAQQNMAALNSQLNAIDPSGTLASLFGGMLGGSLFQQNLPPAALLGAMSLPAATQVAGNPNTYGATNQFNWIPGMQGQTGGVPQTGGPSGYNWTPGGNVRIG